MRRGSGADLLKRLPMLFLLVAPYALLAGRGEKGTLALLAAAVLVNAVYAFCLPRLGFTGEALLRWCVLLKLAHIPFFVLIFAMALLANVLLLPLLPLLAAVDYALVLSTSAYGLSALRCCVREGALTKRAALLYGVGQLVFCLDVIGAALCRRRLCAE